MEAVTILLYPSSKHVLLRHTNDGKIELPHMEVPIHKDPMLFAYENLKEFVGTQNIKTQLWFIRTEIVQGNTYVDESHSWYIAAGALPLNIEFKCSDKYFWCSKDNLLCADVYSKLVHKCAYECVENYFAIVKEHAKQAAK